MDDNDVVALQGWLLPSLASEPLRGSPLAYYFTLRRGALGFLSHSV